MGGVSSFAVRGESPCSPQHHCSMRLRERGRFLYSSLSCSSARSKAAGGRPRLFYGFLGMLFRGNLWRWAGVNSEVSVWAQFLTTVSQIANSLSLTTQTPLMRLDLNLSIGSTDREAVFQIHAASCWASQRDGFKELSKNLCGLSLASLWQSHAEFTETWQEQMQRQLFAPHPRSGSTCGHSCCYLATLSSLWIQLWKWCHQEGGLRNPYTIFSKIIPMSFNSMALLRGKIGGKWVQCVP